MDLFDLMQGGLGTTVRENDAVVEEAVVAKG
jgi:hypothetical protein